MMPSLCSITITATSSLLRMAPPLQATFLLSALSFCDLHLFDFHYPVGSHVSHRLFRITKIFRLFAWTKNHINFSEKQGNLWKSNPEMSKSWILNISVVEPAVFLYSPRHLRITAMSVSVGREPDRTGRKKSVIFSQKFIQSMKK